MFDGPVHLLFRQNRWSFLFLICIWHCLLYSNFYLYFHVHLYLCLRLYFLFGTVVSSIFDWCYGQWSVSVPTIIAAWPTAYKYDAPCMSICMYIQYIPNIQYIHYIHVNRILLIQINICKHNVYDKRKQGILNNTHTNEPTSLPHGQLLIDMLLHIHTVIIWKSQ